MTYEEEVEVARAFVDALSELTLLRTHGYDSDELREAAIDAVSIRVPELGREDIGAAIDKFYDAVEAAERGHRQCGRVAPAVGGTAH